MYAIVAIAWCGTIATDLSINKRLHLSPKGIEFKRAYLYDINPVGFGSMLISSLFGYLAYFGIFGQFLEAFCAPFTLVLTFVLCPTLAFITHGNIIWQEKLTLFMVNMSVQSVKTLLTLKIFATVQGMATIFALYVALLIPAVKMSVKTCKHTVST